MPNFLTSITDWQFLNEPAYRWAIFFIGFTFFLTAWSGVLSFMK